MHPSTRTREGRGERERMAWHPPRTTELWWGWGGALGPAQGGGCQWKPRGLSWRVPSPTTFQGPWEGTPGLRAMWGSGGHVCISWGRHGGPHRGSRTPLTPPVPAGREGPAERVQGAPLRPGQAGQGHCAAHAPQPHPAHTGPRAAAGRLRLQAGGGEDLAGRAGPWRGLDVATR